jgi:outer membrane immunogenic protein
MRRISLAILATTAIIITALGAGMQSASAAPASYNWSGWYIGGNIGYGWGVNSDPGLTFADPGGGIGLGIIFAAGGNVTPDVQPKGVIGGVQIGYNWKMPSNWVMGLVADFQGSGMKASGTNSISLATLGGFPTIQSNSVEVDWFGTVRAKWGFASTNWMPYVTGGLAYGHVKSSGSISFPTAPAVNPSGSNTTTKAGWTVGGGLDVGVLTNWIVGFEYLYVNLGHVSYTETIPNFPGASVTIDNRVGAHIARLTASFKF